MRGVQTVEDLRLLCKRRIPKFSFEYLESGTGKELALSKNISAFDNFYFQQSFFKGELKPNVETNFLGTRFSAPFGIAPIGLSGLIWPKAELALAKCAEEKSIPFVLSTVATENPEEFRDFSDSNKWFQLYAPKDESVLVSLLSRAKSSGFRTLVITVDIPMPSKRERSKAAGVTVPLRPSPRLLWQAIIKPLWLIKTLVRGLPRLRTIEEYTARTNINFVAGYVGNRLGGTLDWAYCRRVRDLWEGKIVVKGITSEEDFKKCIEFGFDAVYISNHGGRQFDGGDSPLNSLSTIAKLNREGISIIYDGGVRNGLDVLKAIALGADFVMLGRSFMYGVGASFKNGSNEVYNILLSDMIINMAQIGVNNLSGLSSKIRKL
jgi:L-lactate dehydrogenase (cytochrome)